ncbi:hypothetical protein Tco_0561844 [Tanacetum coccineum]
MRIPCVSVDKKERRVSLAPEVILGPSSGVRLALAFVSGGGVAWRHSPVNPGVVMFLCVLAIVRQSEEIKLLNVTTLPKFDMSSYESTMTAKDVKSLALRHGIPLDLHPVALTNGWTMDKLPDDMIGLYEYKQGHWFSFEKRVGKGVGGQIFRETFSGLKGWKKRFFFLDRRVIPDAMAWRHHDSYINDPTPEDGFSVQDVQTLTERVIDLRPIPFGLLFQRGLATTWDFPGFHPIFKDTKGNERKARAATKKKEMRRQGDDGGEGSRPKTKRRKIVVHKDGFAASKATSLPAPLRTIIPTDPTRANPSGAAATTAESREDKSLYTSSHDSVDYSVQRYADGHDDNEETNSLRLGSFVDQSIRNLNIVHTEVFQSSPGNHSAHPSLTVERRTSLVRSPLQELMVHLAPLATQEESNALNNSTALERAWFSLARGALDQTDILERLGWIWSSHLYTTLADRYKVVKSEHEGCAKKLEVLENWNSELSQVNKDQALWIKELDDELAKKDSALVYAEKINSDRAQEKKKLSHEYKQNLSEPFNLAIQAGWAKGLVEEHSEEDLLELMIRMEDFDAYADKKMYVYPDSPPPGQAPPSKPSSRKSPSSSAPNKL